LYRALIFDLDGTLAETDSLHLPTWSNSKVVEALLPGLPTEDGRDLVAEDFADPDLIKLLAS
jgi:beta-phosphoglucomutase-like phosphatase (HAD superfamily)